jgi:hypothetical protein
VVREGGPAAAVVTNIAAKTVTVIGFKEKEARVYTVAVARSRAGAGGAVQAPAGEARQQDPAVGFESSDGMFEGMSVTKTKRVVSGDDSEEVWIAKEVGLVVFRQVRKAGTVTTRRVHSIAVKEPLGSLFEIPPDFTVVHEEGPEGVPTPSLAVPAPRRLPAEFPKWGRELPRKQ